MPVQFTVKLDCQAEALADLLQALAARGIDLRSIGLTSVANQAAAVFTTNSDALTYKVLSDGHYVFYAGEVVITSVPDQRGAFAAVARRLACSGIVLRGVVLLRWYQGKAELALSVDDPVAARTALAIAPVVSGSWQPPASPPARRPNLRVRGTAHASPSGGGGYMLANKNAWRHPIEEARGSDFSHVNEASSVGTDASST